MKKQLLSWLSYCLVVFAVLLAACSHLNLPEPQVPSTAPSAALLTAARDWFAQVVPATPKSVVLNWVKAHTLDGWLIIPLADTTSPFIAEHKQAYRYLVAQRTTANAFTGRIVEVVLEGKAPVATSIEQAVLVAIRRLLATPQGPVPLPGINGLLLFYSPAYHYENGFVYHLGQPLVERVRFLHSPRAGAVPARPAKGASPQGAIDNEGTADCIMELRCSYVGDNLSNCIYVPHCFDSNSGGGDGGGWGGDSGGGGASSPTVLVDTQGAKTDPKQENRCFTTSQAATLTVYVEQAKSGTRDHVGPNQVGHTFVGIQQNGITRYLGYYPPPSASSTGLAVGFNYPGEIHENSGHNYDVSITGSITGGQLAAILSYINNYPATYNLNSYNCADFGIAVGNLGGMNLPATTNSGIFSGRSPGDLGEDIRAMTPPSGGSINTAGGNAPTKQGTCP